ncbi:MAG: mechanosensitive ion channel family protein, partial [Lachnospiraceae bacterium]|nr:mechanosensitive ion channel family protein [Lachnospiraceae bacterium]
MNYEQILTTLVDKGLNLGGRILFALIFLFIGMQLIKLVRKILKKSMEKA